MTVEISFLMCDLCCAKSPHHVVGDQDLFQLNTGWRNDGVYDYCPQCWDEKLEEE